MENIFFLKNNFIMLNILYMLFIYNIKCIISTFKVGNNLI